MSKDQQPRPDGRDMLVLGFGEESNPKKKGTKTNPNNQHLEQRLEVMRTMRTAYVGYVKEEETVYIMTEAITVVSEVMDACAIALA